MAAIVIISIILIGIIVYNFFNDREKMMKKTDEQGG